MVSARRQSDRKRQPLSEAASLQRECQHPVTSCTTAGNEHRLAGSATSTAEREAPIDTVVKAIRFVTILRADAAREHRDPAD